MIADWDVKAKEVEPVGAEGGAGTQSCVGLPMGTQERKCWRERAEAGNQGEARTALLGMGVQYLMASWNPQPWQQNGRFFFK